MGDYHYDSVINTIGEDRLVDLILLKLAEAEHLNRREKNIWVEDWEKFQSTFGLESLIYLVLIPVSATGPLVGTLITLAAFIFIFRGALKKTLDNALFRVGGDYASLIASLIGIALLGGIGFGLWKAFPWLVKGVQDWWGWLGGHFQ